MVGIKGRETITILRREYTGAVDEDYGVSVPTDSEIIVKNVLIGWGGTADSVSTIQESINTSATLFLPRGTVTKNDDKFRLPDGSVWTKNGGTTNWATQAGGRAKPRPIVEITRVEG